MIAQRSENAGSSAMFENRQGLPAACLEMPLLAVSGLFLFF